MWRRIDAGAIVRCLAAAAGLALCVWFLLPLGSGIFHVGMIWPVPLLLLGASLCLFPGWHRRLPLSMRRAAGACLGAGLLLIAALLGLMIGAACAAPETSAPPETVIVLGCQVRDDGKPSAMLRARINAAYDYLAAHPEAVCIASGGMDDSEPFTEASSIADTLQDMGIDAGRIYCESGSHSTYENLACSAQVIAAEGLDGHVVIATDTFHQYRAAYYARRAGLAPSAVCAAPYLPLAPSYWTREMLGILAAWVRGY